MRNFSTRLREARIGRGLSQRDLIEMSEQTDLAAYEAGDTSPRIDRVARLADALEVHPAWLAFGREASSPSWLRDVSAAGYAWRLSTARKLANRRQEDLATAVGMTAVSIGEMEAAGRLPRLDVVEKLATDLSVNPLWLTYWIGSP